MAEKLLRDLSQQALNRELPGESVHALVHRLGAMNVRKWEDNFLGQTIKDEYDVVAASGDGVDGTWAIEAGDNHAKLSASTGAGSSGECNGAALPGLAFRGEYDAVTVMRLTLSAITSIKCEFGFTDAGFLTDNGAVDALATPTYTASDAAVWCFDTSDTTYWQALAVQGDTGITKLEPEIAPVALTYEYLGVALRGTYAKFLRWNDSGLLTYESAWQEDAITAATPLTPWLFIELRGSVDRNIHVQKWMAWENFTSS